MSLSTDSKKHPSDWQHRLQLMLNQSQRPHSLLFVGPRHANVSTRVDWLIHRLLCQKQQACGQCKACCLLARGHHPDLDYVRQESPGQFIKIDAIRALQSVAYQTPQYAEHRFIVIDSADKMNLFAANALLKLLEEPPSKTVLILIAEQMGTLLPTIISRCQKILVPDPLYLMTNDFSYLSLGKGYAEDTSRSILYNKQAIFITAISDVIEHRCSLCTVAASWSEYPFEDVLWLLYLIHAQLIREHWFPDLTDASKPLLRLRQLTTPVLMFHQMEKIKALMKNINHTIHNNMLLALEDFLTGYLE